MYLFLNHEVFDKRPLCVCVRVCVCGGSNRANICFKQHVKMVHQQNVWPACFTGRVQLLLYSGIARAKFTPGAVDRFDVAATSSESSLPGCPDGQTQATPGFHSYRRCAVDRSAGLTPSQGTASWGGWAGRVSESAMCVDDTSSTRPAPFGQSPMEKQ